jgi:hypothetical protein
VLLQAALKLALHLTVNLRTPYGFHRDELLYLGMGRHLQIWGMDFPPAIAIVAEASRTLLGDSLTAIRFFPAVFGSAVVVLAALIARELGGGRIAQGLAAFCVLTNPLFLRSANLLQPVVMDQLIWAAALYALVRLCRGYGPGGWLLLGLVLGLGLLTKFSVAFIGLAIVPVYCCRRSAPRCSRPGPGSGSLRPSPSAPRASWGRSGWDSQCSPRWPTSERASSTGSPPPISCWGSCCGGPPC